MASVSEIRLHPFYENLERKFPGIVQSRLKDFSPLAVTSDLYVIRGVTRFLEDPSSAKKAKRRDLSHDSPQVIIAILENVSKGAVLRLEEADKLRDVFEKVKKRCGKKTATFKNFGLTEKVFSFYREKRLPHHLALRICTTLSPQLQQELLDKAGGDLNRFLKALLKARFQDKFKANQGEAATEGPVPDFFESVIDEILNSKEAREILAKKLYERTKEQAISLAIKNIGR